VHIPLLEDQSQRGQLNFTYSLSLTSSGDWSYHQVGSNSYWQWPKTPQGVSFIIDGTPTGNAVGCNARYKDPTTGNTDIAGCLSDGDGAGHPVGGGRTIDGSGYYSTANGIIDKHGITFSGFNNTTCGYSTAGKVVDSNGNQMTCAYTSTPTTGITTVTDTLGRTWTTTVISSDVTGCPVTAQSSTLWAVPGLNGATRTFKFCYSSVSLQTNFQIANILEVSSNPSLMTGVVLPNMKTYRFDYDQYGDIVKITLPTGGTISYTWQNLTYGCSVLADASRVLTSRTLFDGVNTYIWNYSAGVVTDPLGNDTVYTSHNCQDVLQIQYYSGSHTGGSLLKTVANTFQTISDPFISEVYQGVGNPPTLLVGTTTTWPNGQVTQTKRTYDTGFTWSDASNWNWNTGKQDTTPQQGFFGLVTSEITYDYGSGSPGPVLSTANTNYLALSNSSYLSANLLDLKSSVVILSPSGYKCAETDYAYDDSSRLFSSGVTEQHIAPSSVRGNLSSTTRQLTNTPCQASASWSPLTSYHNVYDTGETYQSIDPLGHPTSYAYSPFYYGAYATTITNAVNQSTTNVFDFNTGLLSSTTDPNSLTTSYGYDNMLRVTQVNDPDGGQKTIRYQESGYPFSTTVSDPINPAESKTTTTLFDGLGRPTQTQLTSDLQGTDYTDTAYDALGRVSTVLNPYRKGTDVTTTTGTTTYSYDALGRKTSETYPDNSVLATAYCGSSTLVTDPTKRWRRSRADGLGRLVEVDEPNSLTATVNANGCPASGGGEPIWVTSYIYNPLGNLTNVLQSGSHPRTFAYDSLSHLLTSNNPEVGQISYTYNNDGILTSKTDARGITTNYSPTASPIDALHRVTEITYSNSDPTITYSYDQVACLGLSSCQNIGHRTSMTDGAGSEAWSYQVDPSSHRSAHVDQRTTTSGSSNITKATTYYLDYAGNTTQAIYPTGRTVNYTFDAANRPSSAIDGSSGITYATGWQTGLPAGCSATAACYTPQGTFYGLSLGQTSSFTGLNLTHIYNSRLQPLEFKASSTGGNTIDITYSFVDPVTGKNAAHVSSITNNLNSNRTQNFTYDQLNRIVSAGTSATTGSYCWGYQYSYDTWGNLLSQAGWSPTYNGCTESIPGSVTADGNNHISAFSYDVAGNTQNDGAFAYVWNGESQLKSAAGVNYLYDGDGRRVEKVGSKIYWYGAGGEILAETDASGGVINEYIYFGGRRVALLSWR
jgi:YD repeat-containing protein